MSSSSCSSALSSCSYYSSWIPTRKPLPSVSGPPPNLLRGGVRGSPRTPSYELST
ncbi:unnamed protein product [Brassica oleracea var. botrytis]|uniref:(rape) hypothetical protein n=1 Tax=Brassica napus TaxID=3708 RepID=A0A816MDM8_BRANA|nr:unnamed protein product [Brassica napus]